MMPLTLKMLREMAMRLTQPSESGLDKSSNRKQLYNYHSSLPKYNYDVGNSDFSVHKQTYDGNKTVMSTVDNKNKETVHHSAIIHTKANDRFPYDHQEQTMVERKENTGKGDLPKGHVLNLLHHHIGHSALPLRSSSTQYGKGHDLWERLVHKSIDSGKHVYHWDGKSLHKTTKDNADAHLNKSFGPLNDNSYSDKHMIVSNESLEHKKEPKCLK